jgi:hypothetical protein
VKLARLRQPALSALAVLLISGAGIALAGNRPAAAPEAAPVNEPAVIEAAAPTTEPSADATTEPPADATTEPVEPGGADADTLRQGDQTAPDTAAATGTKALSKSGAAPSETEKAGTEKAGTEKAGAEEPGDANLPGGGHADDPNDPNADHQFEGVE